MSASEKFASKVLAAAAGGPLVLQALLADSVAMADVATTFVPDLLQAAITLEGSPRSVVCLLAFVRKLLVEPGDRALVTGVVPRLEALLAQHGDIDVVHECGGILVWLATQAYCVPILSAVQPYVDVVRRAVAPPMGLGPVHAACVTDLLQFLTVVANRPHRGESSGPLDLVCEALGWPSGQVFTDLLDGFRGQAHEGRVLAAILSFLGDLYRFNVKILPSPAPFISLAAEGLQTRVADVSFATAALQFLQCVGGDASNVLFVQPLLPLVLTVMSTHRTAVPIVVWGLKLMWNILFYGTHPIPMPTPVPGLPLVLDLARGLPAELAVWRSMVGVVGMWSSYSIQSEADTTGKELFACRTTHMVLEAVCRFAGRLSHAAVCVHLSAMRINGLLEPQFQDLPGVRLVIAALNAVAPATYEWHDVQVELMDLLGAVMGHTTEWDAVLLCVRHLVAVSPSASRVRARLVALTSALQVRCGT